ncbi:MAG: replication factor C large subunit [Candidatus Aenigmarchaeota archaeon]|nr:replication factor C large subunit [Candidatus Aenigmarchaeota archaeon]
MELWVNKYKPKTAKEILSQGSALSATEAWLSSWKPGKALLIAGPPGTGKTLIAETVANERGWMLMQVNASDERNSEAVEKTLTEVSRNQPLFHSGKIILIDEVDSLSSGDRGGIQAIVRIVKASRFPIIVTANDPYIHKLQPLRSYAKIVKLSKVDVRSVEKRLREICEAERVEVSGDVLKNLARWSSGDLRSAINDLQMMCEGRKEISERDFEALGFRERESNVFSVLPIVFRCKNITAAKNAINTCDKDADDLFWWIENNIPFEFTDAESLANALDMLSKADIFRQIVHRQQNWRFKAHMVDMLAGISLAGEGTHQYVQYKPPEKFALLAQLRFRNAEMGKIYEKLSAYTHSPQRIVRNEYLPFIKIILSSKKTHDSSGIEFTEEEAKALVSG